MVAVYSETTTAVVATSMVKAVVPLARLTVILPVPLAIFLLKTTFRGASTAAPVEPLAGVSAETMGGPGLSGMKAAVSLLRGAGSPTIKSVEFLSVSVDPESARTMALALLGAGATVPSNVFAVPKPTKSTIPAASDALPAANGAVPFTNATLPVVPLKFIFPVASSGGRLGAVIVVPAASLTRKYPPAGIVPLRAAAWYGFVPDAELY